jgi:hypothetical protein
MQGDFLICNVIGFLGIKHYDLQRNPETGAVWGEPAGDELTVLIDNGDGATTEDKSRGLLMSGDKNFRPTDAIFAPDGSLYFSDWQNVIIGHMQHNVRDPNRDHAHGRIYRMTAIGRPLQKPVPIDGQPISALLENLKSPIDGIRHRTRVELSERDSKEVIAATKEWIKQFDPTKQEDAHHLLEALWLHQQHNVVNEPLLRRMLDSPDYRARAAATRVLCYWRDRVSDSLDLLKQLAADSHPRVRLEAIRAASFFTAPEAIEVPIISMEFPTDEYIEYTRGETMKALEPHWKKALAAGQRSK